MHRISAADAMRLGAAMKPQAYGAMFDRKIDNKTRTSCALGALADGIGVCTSVEVRMEYPQLIELRPPMDLKCGCGVVSHIMCWIGAIVHLNDLHHWTREKIADWLDSVEGRVACQNKSQIGEPVRTM